jgi:RNA polymerase sigma-70 factor
VSLKDAAAFHGDLGLAPATWKTRVIAVLQKCDKSPDDPSAGIFAKRLHTCDLYLATCCAERLETAWGRLYSLYQTYIVELVRCLARNALQATDVGESLLVDLFLPDRSGQSRIASYDGRSSLATWLHVIVTHRMVNERVRKWSTVERPGEMPDVADTSALRELEADIRAKRYGAAIDESLRMACERLSPKDCQMLVWRYQRGLLLEEIARLLSVHPSTVCRHLERLHEQLRKDVIAVLGRRFGFTESIIDECVHDLLENRFGSVSLLRMVRETLPRDRDRCKVAERHLHIA